MGRSGNIFSVFTENPLRKFYSMKVPKNGVQSFEELPEPVNNEFDNLQFGRDLIEDFVTELINVRSVDKIRRTLCHNAHCCSFEIEFETVTSRSSFRYRFVAFNGDRTYSGWGEKKLVICAVILCNDETLDSCGRIPNSDLVRVTFTKVEISTSFKRFGVLMMPNSMDMKMNPFSVDSFAYDEVVVSQTSRASTISLLRPRSDLQTFALYGHDFEVDEEFPFEEREVN